MTSVIARPALLTYNFGLHLIYCVAIGVLRQRVKVSPPTNIMSARPWNAVAKRNILLDLMELLLQAMDEENAAEAEDLDDYWKDFWEGDDMDVNSLSSVDSDDPIEDLDFGEDEPVDLIGDLISMTVVYGEFILEDLQSNVQFNTRHLQIHHLSEVKCVDDFRFRKEDLSTLFELLQTPLGTVLEFVAGLADQVKVKYQYTVPYETGLLMIIYQLLRPYRVRSNMEVNFGRCWAFISAVCGMFIDALYAIAVPYLTNTGLFHHQFPVYAEKIAAKTGNAAINVWGFINRTLKKTCCPMHFQKAALPWNQIPERDNARWLPCPSAWTDCRMLPQFLHAIMQQAAAATTCTSATRTRYNILTVW
jgi:hypothetical protein